ncbi:MAG: hypothetical protein GY757_16480 [bacterium]|nr:hypothetical protein [bacterium]
MSKLKKTLFFVLGILVALVLVFVGINLFDADLDPNAYKESDLPPASFESSNGFFIIWGLAMPEDVDVLSEEFREPFRKLFDPSLNPDMDVTGFDQDLYRKPFTKYNKIISGIKFPVSFEQDWITELTPQFETIRQAGQSCALPLKRYRLLIETPKCAEFTAIHYASPIPNLLAWMKTAKLYTAICTMTAVDGKWEEAVTALLAQIRFGKRAVAGSRTLITNLIAKADANVSLQGLVSIMNHPQCPDTVYPMVLSGLTPLQYEEYGNRRTFICECIGGFNMVDVAAKVGSGDIVDSFIFEVLPASIFLQKNRTKNYYYNTFSSLVTFDETEPYLWKSTPYKEAKKALLPKGSFWWVRNPIGKIIVAVAVPNLSAIIHKGYRMRAYYEMTRLAAGIHMNAAPEQEIGDALQALDDYKKFSDPCSGKPYKWHKKKRVLYSFATDAKDNDAVFKLTTNRGIDWVVPVSKKEKGESKESK